MQAAFKEWAVIVEALGRGEQIFILRKGGIHEGRGGFRMEHDRFLLFSTFFHQQRESIRPGWETDFEKLEAEAAARQMVPVEYFAAVEEHHRLEDFEELKKLSGQHIWKEEVIRERFEWGKEKAIYAIAVRVYRLPMRIELPSLPEYGGCKSWVTLAKDIPEAGAAPVLDDNAFAERLGQFRRALSASGGGLD